MSIAMELGTKLRLKKKTASQVIPSDLTKRKNMVITLINWATYATSPCLFLPEHGDVGANNQCELYG